MTEGEQVRPEQQKTLLRTHYLAYRRSLSADAARAQSLAAQSSLMLAPEWQQARQVALYMPIRGEMDTSLLLEEAWARKMQVLLPRCVPGAAGRMDFVPCQSRARLTQGVFGIWEPSPDCAPLPWDKASLSPDLAVIPALAFDAQGFRLGYGGGYYDRALGHVCFAQTRTVGLNYAACCVSPLPHQAWDFPVQAVCTEEGLKWL